MRNLIGAIAVLVAVSGVAAATQELQQKTKTRITVEDGRDVTLTGCIERSGEHGYVLARAAGKEGESTSYLLVGDKADELDEYLGHRVEVKGKAADKGNGKLKIKSESETASGGSDKKKRESRTEVEGDLDGLPFLGIESIRTLATVCR